MDKPVYRRSEFWLTLSAALPGLLLGLAEVFNQVTANGSIDPNNPLYPLFIKLSGFLIAAYTIARQLNKAIGAYREGIIVQGGLQNTAPVSGEIAI